MIYREHIPAAPLNQHIRMLWYTESRDIAGGRERILPNGCVQIVLNLARDFVWECGEEGRTGRQPASLVVGARSVYEIVDTSDMAELLGITFQPGGFVPFGGGPADLFSGRDTALEDVWGAMARRLRDRLLEVRHPELRLQVLEQALREEFTTGLQRNSMVDFALERFAKSASAAAVSDVAREIGWSARHFSQVFRETVGLTPKEWCRVQRFQSAVRQLHAGVDVRWAELALECGFYDQSHFANEFRRFSGIDATTYSRQKTRWANHVAVS